METGWSTNSVSAATAKGTGNRCAPICTTTRLPWTAIRSPTAGSVSRARVGSRIESAGSDKDAELVSSPVLIDNTPPVIHVRSASRSEIVFDAQDAASVLRRAEWSVDAGPWMAIAPVDGILDSESEQFRFQPEHIAPGEHLVVLRVTDSGNNSALAKVILH